MSTLLLILGIASIEGVIFCIWEYRKLRQSVSRAYFQMGCLSEQMSTVEALLKEKPKEENL